ncbi:alpha/beta hydrolase fold domain-containing protein [Planctomycetota bacterium]
MKNSLLRIVLIIAVVGCVQNVQAEFRVGAAKQIITPSPLLPITGGMGPTTPATKKIGELTARAIVLEKDETRIAIVSIDALGFPAVLGNRVRKLVPRIRAENILIGATHTHSGPDFYAFPDGQGGHSGDLEYMDSVCRKAAEAINAAIDSLQPAQLKSATGEAKGKIAYNYYAPDLYDRRASVLQFQQPAGATIATLVNYAVHPEVLGASEGILSPDLIGPLCDRVEQQAGGMAIFMNGAIGGMITADNRNLDQPSDPQRGYWKDSRTWIECERIGNLLADESLRIVADAEPQADPKLVCKAKDVRFPVESKELWAVVNASPLQYPHNDDHSVTSRLNCIHLGDTQILTIPGEALPNVGFYLKRKMKGKHNLLFGLTNDAFGYIMTKVDYNSFDRYKYISSVSLGEQTGEILISESLALLAETTDANTSGPVEITPDVVYGHKDGLALTMDLYRPTNPNGAAVLFMVSGGWYSKWSPPKLSQPLFQPFLTKGYTVFAVRHGSSPKYSIPNAVADVRRAVRFIRKNERRFAIDASRMGVFGMSAGGHLSLMLGTTGDDGDKNAKDSLGKVSSRVAAVAALVPPTDLRVAVWEAPESLPAYRGFPALNLPMKPAEEHSPLVHVTPDDAPSLVIMGADDELVPAKHGHWIDEALEENNVAHKLIVYPNAGHDLGGLKNLPRVMQQTREWFDLHLAKPKNSP